jgi:outer membrane protein assembly factor BamE (lipoprotein component of BamABCDE complex)
LGAALGGCIGYEGEFERGYQVDSESLDKVKVGATRSISTRAARSTVSPIMV